MFKALHCFTLHIRKGYGKLLLSLLVRIQIVLQLDLMTLTGVVGVGNADTQ